MGTPNRLPVVAGIAPVVVMVRHGETNDNLEPLRFQGRSDTPLNETGMKQARQLAETVVGMGFEALWTSDLARARLTAAPVAQRLGIDPVVDSRLSEGDRGRWEGLLMEDVRVADPDLHAAWRRPDPQFRFPGGESLVEHQRRVCEALDEIVRSGVPTLAVCHGGSIRCMLAERTGLGLGAFHDWDIPNCAMVRL